MVTRAAVLCLLVGFSARAQSVETAAVERQAPRLRAGIGAGPMGALGGPAMVGGLGVGGDLGFVLKDRLAISARLALAYGFVFAYGAATITGEYALSDRASLGVGAGLARAQGLTQGGPSATAVVFPLRLTLWPWARGRGELGRSGFVISVAVSPGAAYEGSWDYPPSMGPPRVPAFAIATEITLGYAQF